MSVSADTLLRQASYTSELHFKEALKVLVNSGLPYSAADVVALAAISAQDFHTGIIAKCVEDVLEELRYVASKE